MNKVKNYKPLLLFSMVVSIIGLSLVPLLLTAPNLQPDVLPFRGIAVSIVYWVICVVGIIAVFYPGKCRISFKKASNINKGSSFTTAVELEGHHPKCEKFSPNRIAIRNAVFCSACTGLLVGAIVTLVLIVLFALGLFNLDMGKLWILAIGEILMLIGLVQIKMGGYVKLAVNAFFVIGSCFMLISADLLGRSLLVDGYVLGLIVFMLWFRILLSEWNNKQTCVTCGRCS